MRNESGIDTVPRKLIENEEIGLPMEDISTTKWGEGKIRMKKKKWLLQLYKIRQALGW